MFESELEANNEKFEFGKSKDIVCDRNQNNNTSWLSRKNPEENGNQ